MDWLYRLFGNYGWALVGFTILVNLLLLPLTVKQQKSTAAMQKIQPELQKLQNKYKNDKEKLNTEMMKLYQKQGVNPMSGCLPLLIQLPIILILYQVIIKPLSYMMHLSADQISVLAELTGKVQEMDIAAALSTVDLSGLDFAVETINFNFFGLDLGATPSFSHFSVLWIIPVLAGVTTYLQSWLTQRQTERRNKDGKKEENAAASQMQTMTKIMPLMTVWFAFSFAAGIGFYWIVSNICRTIIQLVLDYMMREKTNPPEEEASRKEEKKDGKNRSNRKNS